ncbi:WD repeat protein iqw1 [Leucoagaricus sp. SymC.cos]|nr:WD repeat protein iqw1 [Leucoagaricus sp. SymC.cos]
MSSLPSRSLFDLRASLPSIPRADRNRNLQLSYFLHQPLDRVNVLGKDDGTYGHAGCVNALSWSHNGEILLTGGDDTTVRLWRMDSSDTEQEYPFVCRSVFHTGHTGNIFNAQLLPYSTHLITVAADKQIRVSDITMALNNGVQDSLETQYTIKQSVKKILRCHSNRVKRIVTEDSPALFLTVSEDGTVRQHDLRTAHNCRQNGCPMSLLKLNHDLSTVSLSTLTPYQFVVAGEAPYGYLFDRRNVGRRIEEEWGVPSSTEEVTTCVRRFGRPPRVEKKKRFPRDHITGSRMSNYNGHEILLSYSGDATYLFSALDSPTESEPSSTFASSSGTPEQKRLKLSQSRDEDLLQPNLDVYLDTGNPDTLESDAIAELEIDVDEESEGSKEDEIEEEEALELETNYHPGVPTIMPRQRFPGARNVETVKDVNFLGPKDELVVSGSDDGNFFVWDKSTTQLNGIYEGDGSIVNVIEGHPSLPLIAVSGIDTTVKLFAPARGASRFSRLEYADQILETNSRPVPTFDLRMLLAEAMLRSGSSSNECINQ